jgi:mannose-6-phosphate isomerase-like protein (cupin superfamily)
MEKMEVKEVEKEWGKEVWMTNTDLYCGKKLILQKGKRCSIHHHKNKDETFYLDEGLILLEVNEDSEVIKPGTSIRISKGENHRFSGLKDSVIIEISTHHDDEDSYRIEVSGDVPEEVMEKYGGLE